MTRLNVNINDETAAAIREAMEQGDITATEGVRRALSSYARRHRGQKRGRIELVEEDGGTVTRVVIL